MKIRYDSNLNLYIIADDLKVMTMTPKQFSTLKTMANIKSEFHKRIDMDKEICYNQNMLKDEEE